MPYAVEDVERRCPDVGINDAYGGLLVDKFREVLDLHTQSLETQREQGEAMDAQHRTSVRELEATLERVSVGHGREMSRKKKPLSG